MEKQTAVEWLENQINNMIKNGGDLGDDYPALLKHIEHAKQMEKEQHDKTAEDWWKEGAHYVETQGMAEWENFEEYWEERFKTK